MCAKKLKYTAGDDLQLYATPKQALEANKRREQEEREKARRLQQKQQELRMAQEARMNSRVSSAPSGYGGYSSSQGGSSTSLPHSTSSHQHQHHYSSSQQAQTMPPVHRVPPQQHIQRAANGGLGGDNYIHASQMGIVPPSAVSNHGRPIPAVPVLPASMTSMDSPGRRSSSGSPHRRTSPKLEDKNRDRDIAVATTLFFNHDVKKRGRLTAEELQNLLQNDDSTRFSISAIDSLINLFGAARFGTVNQGEFVSLYKRVKTWRKVYVDNDINGSLTLSLTEYLNSLKELGYLIPFEVGEKLFEQYAEFNMAQNSNAKELKFDKFVESVVWLLQLTKQFRKYDTNQEGVATIQYKDFIETTLMLARFLPH